MGKNNRPYNAKIDWNEAFHYWLALPQRTWMAVARKYGVSESVVRKHARKERWKERAKKFDEKLQQRLEDKFLQDVAKIRLEMQKMVLAAIKEAWDSGIIRDSIRTFADFERAVRLSLHLAGEAESSTEVRETQAVDMKEIYKAALKVRKELKEKGETGDALN